MPSLKELAKEIIQSFDPSSSRKIAEVLAEILHREGSGKYEAYDQADRLSGAVLDVLRNKRPDELPFDFGLSDPTRLVGKRRKRKSDTAETFMARQLWQFADDVLSAILEKDKIWFEILSAACLKLSGAKEAYALCSGDEGGIDLFGRIPIGQGLPGLVRGVLETNLLRTDILFLGQCKRYDPDSKIGPKDVRDFMWAVRDCVNKYEGNPKPPSHRVPDIHYKKGELCIPIFMATADYSARSEGMAQSTPLIIIRGRQICEFLCSRKIGFVQVDDGYQFSKDLFYSWWQRKSDEVDYRKVSSRFRSIDSKV